MSSASICVLHVFVEGGMVEFQKTLAHGELNWHGSLIITIWFNAK